MLKNSNSKKRVSPNFSYNLITLCLILIGINVILLYTLWRVNQGPEIPDPLTSPQLMNQPTSFARPQKLIIPRLETELNIDQTEITNGEWEISRLNASYLTNSGTPGQPGSIIIYGHNTKNIFGSLNFLVNGDQLTLISEDGNIHRYIVFQKEIVSPNQIEVLAPSSSETLILYTCTGPLDSKRLVIKAEAENFI